jgi:hypothetical protein
MLVGCTDAGCAKTATSLNSRHKIQLYSGGKLIGEWTSTGKVMDDDSGSGYYFVDEKTKLLVRVQGDAVVEELE